MAKLRLVVPCERHRLDWLAYLAEWQTTGVGMTPWALDPCEGDFDKFLATTRNFEAGVDIPANKVRSGLFLLMRENDERILGAVSIRYVLNDYLLHYGGNIGYGVRPAERRKGYATAMLALALGICRDKGMTRVLVTCDTDNVASARTILKNGGKFENEVIHPGGSPVQRYWIEI